MDEQTLRELNPTLPAHPDPYPIYRELREHHPVFWNCHVDGWVFSRYADAVEILHHEALGRGGYVERLEAQFGKSLILESYRNDLGFLDPPDHTRLRALVSKAFTPIAVAAMRPRIAEITDELLDLAAGAGTMDVISQLGYPLPLAVICDMLGIDRGEREQFKNWVYGVVRARGLVHDRTILEAADRGYASLAHRLDELLAERRRAPRDDLLSALLAAEEGAQRLTHAEVITTVVTLFGAGHETTKNLIGNGVLALLRNPDQLELLRRSPELIDSAVEEFLRYDSPTQAPPPRVAHDGVVIGGQLVRRGESVSVLLGAANRDPAEFVQPDRLDITRHPNHHLAFSLGIHYCLGAGLARAEARSAIGRLVERMPALRLATDRIEWQKADRFRGPLALVVAF